MSQSQASLAFAESIKDAENLLAHFDKLNTKPPPPENEVLKRAGLVMAMTAWETYVEDRLTEAALTRLSAIQGSWAASFIETRLEEEVRKLHNPSSEKTIQLFTAYAGVDVSAEWKWSNVDPTTAKQRLNGYLKLRGDVVHRSRLLVKGSPLAHPVTREELQKAVVFLKELVKATERALALGHPV